MRRHFVRALCVVVPFLLWGCSANPSTTSPDYKTLESNPHRNSEAARRLNEEGVTALTKGEIENAQKKFKDALVADVTFGPAHNNLGKVYFKQDNYYLAAWEFQYAMKLMPTNAAPQNNLAMVFEAAGKLDEAITGYRKALQLQPEVTEFKANLARALVRKGDRSDELRELLKAVASDDQRAEWRDWAQLRLIALKTP